MATSLAWKLHLNIIISHLLFATDISPITSISSESKLCLISNLFNREGQLHRVIKQLESYLLQWLKAALLELQDIIIRVWVTLSDICIIVASFTGSPHMMESWVGPGNELALQYVIYTIMNFGICYSYCLATCLTMLRKDSRLSLTSLEMFQW